MNMNDAITITPFFDETTLTELHTLETDFQEAKRKVKAAQTELSKATDDWQNNIHKVLMQFVERAVQGEFGKGEVYLRLRRDQENVVVHTFSRLLPLLGKTENPLKIVINSPNILQDILADYEKGEKQCSRNRLCTFYPSLNNLATKTEGRYVEIPVEISTEEKASLLQQHSLLRSYAIWMDVRKDFTDPKMFVPGTKIFLRFYQRPFHYYPTIGVVLPSFRVAVYKDQRYPMDHGLENIFADPEKMDLTEAETDFLKRQKR